VKPDSGKNLNSTKQKSRQCLHCRLSVHIRRPVLYAAADVNLHSNQSARI
jgi:hypothetical protein